MAQQPKVWSAMKFKDEVQQLQKNLEMQVKKVDNMIMNSAAQKIHVDEIRKELSLIHKINERISYYVGLER